MIIGVNRWNEKAGFLAGTPFAQPAHPKLRRNLIVPILAYRLQEQAYGTPSHSLPRA
jgi:hypothetical protein